MVTKCYSLSMSNEKSYKNPSREYLKALKRKDRYELAEKVGVNGHYLTMVASGARTASRNVNVRIENETAGEFKDADFTAEVRALMHSYGR